MYWRDCKCVPALLPCLPVELPVSQSTCLCARLCVKAGIKNRRQAENEEVLSVSAGWAGSWWEHEGRRLAGRSHALFKHHSDGARPLGQNTTRFWATHTRVNTTHTCQNWDFEFCSRGLPQQIQNQDCGSTTISKLQVLSKLLKMCASYVFQKHLCESPEQHWCGERPVKPVPSSLVAGIVPVSSEAVLPVRSEKQYNQDRHLYHAVY